MASDAQVLVNIFAKLPDDAMRVSLNSSVWCSSINIYLYVEGLIFKDLSNTLNMDTANFVIPTASSEGEENENSAYKKMCQIKKLIRNYGLLFFYFFLLTNLSLLLQHQEKFLPTQVGWRFECHRYYY